MLSFSIISPPKKKASLKSFREKVAEKLSIDESAFKLIYIGRLLKDDDKTLEELGMTYFYLIFLTHLRLEIKDGVSVFVLKTQVQVQEIQCAYLLLIVYLFIIFNNRL